MAERHRDVCILQPGYMPWLGYFDQAKLADVFVMYDDVQFDKNGWRNRNRACGPKGPVWLTVPVLHSGRTGQLVRDVEIGAGDWVRRHLGTLRACYARAPYFKDVFLPVEALLRSGKYRRLVDLNHDVHTLLAGMLGVAENRVYASELGVPALGRTERLVDICRRLKATRYISSDASRVYMREELWRHAGIELVYQNFPNPPYPQYGAFVPRLSAIDALMWCGPEAARLVGISHAKDKAPPS
jgi:hypothetical protein